MTQAVWKSPFISLLLLSYRESEDKGWKWLQEVRFPVCFLLYCRIAHSDTICCLLVHSAFEIPV